jgi:hypothetical protein
MSRKNLGWAAARMFGLFGLACAVIALFGVVKALEFAAAVAVAMLVILLVMAVGTPPTPPPTRGAW